jgi:hypothetical protein
MLQRRLHFKSQRYERLRKIQKLVVGESFHSRVLLVCSFHYTKSQERREELLCLEFENKVNDLLDGGDVGGFLFRDFAVEFFLNSHDQFDGIQRVSTKVIDESGRVDNLVSIDAKLRDNDLLDLALQFSGHEEGSGGGTACDESRRRRGECRGTCNKEGSNESLLEHHGVVGVESVIND